MSGVMIYNNVTDNNCTSSSEEEEEYFYVCLSCYTVLQDETSIKKHRKRLHTSTDKKTNKPSKTWLVLTKSDLSPVLQLTNYSNNNSRSTDKEIEAYQAKSSIIIITEPPAPVQLLQQPQIIKKEDYDVNIPLPIPIKIESDSIQNDNKLESSVIRRTTTNALQEKAAAPGGKKLQFAASSNTNNNCLYSCEVCYNSFRSAWDLKRHKKSKKHEDNYRKPPIIEVDFPMQIKSGGEDDDCDDDPLSLDEHQDDSNDNNGQDQGVDVKNVVVVEGSDGSNKRKIGGTNLHPQLILDELIIKEEHDDDEQGSQPQLHVFPNSSSSSVPLDPRPCRTSVVQQRKNLYIEESASDHDDDDDDMDFEPGAAVAVSHESEQENELENLVLRGRRRRNSRQEEPPVAAGGKKLQFFTAQSSSSSSSSTNNNCLYSCEVCYNSFRSAWDLKRHKKSKKHEENCRKPQIRPKIYPSPQVNNEEPIACTKDLLSCVFCPCKFNNWSDLRNHMKNMKPNGTFFSETYLVTPLETKATTARTDSEGSEAPTTTTTPDPENTGKNVPPEDAQPQEAQVTTETDSSPKLKCPLCSAAFTHLSPYNVHITSTHPPTPAAHHGTTCAHCGKSYKHDRDLKKHVQYQHCFPQYSRRPYPCPSCSATFKNPAGLRSHTLFNHTSITPYMCKICGRPCHSPASLSIHLATHAPPSERPVHLCSICGTCCKSEQYLAWHIRMHSEDRPRKCKKCPASFKTRKNLKDHVQTVHSGIKYPCSHCDQVYSKKYTMKLHVKATHLGLSKSHVCSVCGAGFELATKLNAHVKFRHGEAKHECGLCGKKFRLMVQLKSHLVVHDNSEGAKRFACKVCGKKFKLKTGLVQHSTCHLAEEQKKHVCSACGKRFGLPWHLRQHEAAHHKDHKG